MNPTLAVIWSGLAAWLITSVGWISHVSVLRRKHTTSQTKYLANLQELHDRLRAAEERPTPPDPFRPSGPQAITLPPSRSWIQSVTRSRLVLRGGDLVVYNDGRWEVRLDYNAKAAKSGKSETSEQARVDVFYAYLALTGRRD